MQHSKIKIMTIVGTRPEIIRLSRTIALFDEHVNHILVHTGQNYDYELNEIFFNDLEIRKPDYFLEIDTISLGKAVGDIIRKSEEVLQREKPDALLVLGDTNSSLAAYIAKRLHIPIFHMEAGNRSFDFNVPEEINRRIIDHLADFNLVYTEHARRHLISEGLPHRRIYLTGSPMKEVLNYYRLKIDASRILEELNLASSQQPALKTKSEDSTANIQRSAPSKEYSEPNSKYFLVSIHREENVDNPENLKKILKLMDLLAENYKAPVIVSTHPRTRKRLESFGNPLLNSVSSPVGGQKDNTPIALNSSLIHFMKPFSFTDYIHLQMHAICVISDSGTISEESAILGFPAISLRQSMERPEAQDCGTIILTGFNPDIVLQSVELVLKEFDGRLNTSGNSDHGTSNIERLTRDVPIDYQNGDTSWRVLKLIMGNARLSNNWWGINI